MDDQRIKKLLDKYPEKSLTPEETAELDRWYQSFDQATDDEHLRHLPKEELKERIFSRIVREAQIGKKRNLKQYLGWAAVVALVMISSFTYYTRQNKADWLPAEGVAEIPQVILEVPAGKVIKRVLPDGSTVWLNAGSKIIYNKKFEGSERWVNLEGEGFFEVTPNLAKPFIVQCGTFQTRVLGTSFTVKSLANINIFEVTVRTGKVQVNNSTNILASLLPLQRLSIEQDGEPVLSTVENDRFISWTTGEFYVDNQTFREIAWRLEQRFGMKVIINDAQLEKLRFSGDLTGLSVQQAFDILKEIHPFHVQYNDSAIEIRN